MDTQTPDENKTEGGDVSKQVIHREPDSDGYHRLPVSSCCRAAVLHQQPKTHLYVAWQGGRLSGVPEGEMTVLYRLHKLRCGRCNTHVVG